MHHIVPPLPYTIGGLDKLKADMPAALYLLVFMIMSEICVWTSMEAKLARCSTNSYNATPVTQVEFDQSEPYKAKEPVAGGGV